jgi:hypothetical protein
MTTSRTSQDECDPIQSETCGRAQVSSNRWDHTRLRQVQKLRSSLNRQCAKRFSPFFLLLFSTVAHALTFGDFTYTSIGSVVTITGYTGPGGAVSIPAAITGQPVTTVGSFAFSGIASITSIDLPDNVTEIGFQSFFNCTGLTTVTFGNSISTLGNSAFRNCSKLTSIEIPNTITSFGTSAFQDCSSLTSVTIDDGVSEIGDTAFSGCTKIPSIIIPGSVSDIGSSAFAGCTSLVTVSIGSGVLNIGDFAFNGCTKIVTIDLPNSVTALGFQAFFNCSGLTTVTLGNAIVTLGNSAFRNCIKLTGIEIPGSVSTFGSSAFQDCISLVTATIGDGVTDIGDAAFSGCTKLAAISIPGSVGEIGSSAFSGCTSLASVTIGDGVTNIGDFAFSGCTKVATISVPNSVVEIGFQAFINCTGLTAATLGNGVVTVGSSVFRNCSKLSAIQIPGSVSNFGSSAFQDCINLASAEIDNGVTEIGDGGFNGCTKLTSISIPGSVGPIGSSAFSGCTSLTSATINVGVTSIGDFAFSGCTKLASIDIPDSVTSIGFQAFINCTGLASASLGNGVVTLEGSAFRNCSKLASITIPGSVSSFGSSVFQDCISLANATIVNGVTAVGASAFAGCTKLASISIPGSVGPIGGSAFSGCTALSSVIIGDGVTQISNFAFNGCTKLPAIVIPNSVTSIDFQAFVGCTGLIGVTVGNGVVSFGGSAFRDCTNLSAIFFSGDAPTAAISDFTGANSSTVYYLLGTSGWTNPWQGRPTAIWSKELLMVNSAGPSSVAIASSTGHSGTTFYTKIGITNGTLVNLQAPTTDPVGFVFSHWTLDGTDQAAGEKSLVFAATTSSLAVAEYGLPPAGSLQVSISPPSAVAAGAHWTVDGGATNNSGDTVPNLSVGNHTVHFTTAPGFTAPNDEIVVISPNATTSITGTYIASPVTVSMSSGTTNSTNASTIHVSVTFSGTVTGFTADDITPANGTVSNFVGSGAIYSFDLTPLSQGLVSADIPADVAIATIGASNLAAPQFSRIYDTVSPTVTLSSGVANPTNASPMVITVTFSEAVSGFTQNSITAQNATVSGFGSSTSSSYHFNLTPTITLGVVSANVAGSACTDLAGNVNIASNSFSRDFDNDPPAPPQITTNDGNNFETTATSLILEGIAGDDTTVTIRVNNSTAGVTYTAGESAWQFEKQNLPFGDNSYSITGADELGNVSTPANIVVRRTPNSDVFVSPAGDDDNLEGTANIPWKTVTFAVNLVAPFATQEKPITVNLLPGTYTEQVVLEPNVNLRGADPDDPGQSVIEFAGNGNALDPNQNVVLFGANGSTVSDLTVTFGSDKVTADGTLLVIDGVVMSVNNVIMDGKSAPNSTSVEVLGASSTESVIQNSVLQNVTVGLIATDSGVRIARNLFETIATDAIVIEPSNINGDLAFVPLLGLANDLSTGLNRFRDIGGMFVRSASPTQTFAENNDWGVYTAPEIEAQLTGSEPTIVESIDYDPWIGKALVPGCVVVGMHDSVSHLTIQDDVQPQVVIGDFAGEREPISQLWIFIIPVQGNYTVTGNAENYVTEIQSVTVLSSRIVNLDLIMKPIAGDVDGNGRADAIDVQLTINAALGLDINGLDADLNGDGEVNAVDVQLVINAALGLKSA